MKIKWDFKSSYSFSNKNFSKIYDFFVIKSPIDGVSVRGISFKNRNINLIELCAYIKRESKSLKEKWEMVTKKQIVDKLNEYNIYSGIENMDEIAIHTKNTKYNLEKTESFFYCIRCSFAHGSFSIHRYKKEKYYILENKDYNEIKGRIIIKENTLLKIVDYCNSKM